ncbi:MAG: PKD domain-containing protein, partial [Bacteroidales bacterium]|nr:PKD domain-containing protein [Bacteroidales bacterium]
MASSTHGTRIASFQFSSPSSPPVAEFSANNLYPANSMTTVIFTDQSTGSPTTWSWSFSPNTVTYIVGNSSSQNPQVRFNNNGAYTVSLYVTNAFGNDTETKTDYIHVGQPGLWTGTTSTNWNTTTNWDNEEIPTSLTDVSMTPAAISWPIKTGNLTVGTDCNSLNMSSGITELTITGDLIISTGKTLYVDPTGLATIKVEGNWTNNGTFTHGNGTIEFNGTNNSVINSPPGGPAYLINDDISTWPGSWNGDVSGGAGQFGQSASSNAGGTSPEAVFTRGANITATRMMYHNPVNTTGLTSLTLSFTHSVDYRQTGTIIKVQYSTDGTNWFDAGWSVSPTGNIAATPVTVPLTTSEGVGAANYYIAFVFYGRLNRIDYWYIDNVQLYFNSPGLETFNNITINKTNAIVSTNGDIDILNDFMVKSGAYFTN